MPHLEPQLLRLPSEGQALKTPSSESQRDLCPQALQGYSKQRQLLLGTGTLNSSCHIKISTEGAGKEYLLVFS